MSKVVPGRTSADIEGDFVVFLIGIRFNKPWHVRKWWMAFTAMPVMLRHLSKNPELGLLGYVLAWSPSGPMVVQYWRSVEQLEAFAHNAAAPHHPAWKKWNKLGGYKSPDVGIWHESYQVKAGDYECAYGNMPAFGLAKAGSHVPASKKGYTAAQRRGAQPVDAQVGSQP